MIRWFRSVAAVLRRLLWPLPKDFEPVPTAGQQDGASIVAGVVTASGKLVWMIDGAEVEVVSWTAPNEADPGTAAASADEVEPAADQAPEPDPAPETPTPQPRDGRQNLAMPLTGAPLDALFGRRQTWAPRRDFRCAPWENIHTFAGPRPRRDDYGLHGMTDPLSMICPACELEQPPLMQGERGCPYCGLRLQISGTYVLWWRAAIEPALQWPPRALDGGR